jgi:hypothetical protein
MCVLLCVVAGKIIRGRDDGRELYTSSGAGFESYLHGARRMFAHTRDWDAHTASGKVLRARQAMH